MIQHAGRTMTARMLVVDDDLRSRKLLQGYLQSEGHHVVAAEDGLTALELLQREVPDVVLLDVMMPGMNGHEVCAAVKSHPRTRLCQVMLVTALDGTPDKVAGLDTGADDYVTKPVRREEFLAKVRALLRVRRSLLDLEQARSELSERNRELELKKTLVQSLVHDLKSPLAAILANLDLVEERGGQDLRYLVQRCKQGTSRMLKMILNLLDVEALEQGKLLPGLDRVDAIGVVRAAVEEAEAAAGNAAVELAVRGPAEASLAADPVLLRRVIDNLLSNALVHAPRGSRVEIIVSARDEGLEIAVSDRGPGIPEEFREKVFEKYARIETQAAGIGSNRGLGLSFCRLAVEAHGGTIWVEAAPEGGACFRALLPARDSAGVAIPCTIPRRG